MVLEISLSLMFGLPPETPTAPDQSGFEEGPLFVIRHPEIVGDPLLTRTASAMEDPVNFTVRFPIEAFPEIVIAGPDFDSMTILDRSPSPSIFTFRVMVEPNE